MKKYQVDKYAHNKDLETYLNEQVTKNVIDSVEASGTSYIVGIDGYEVTVNGDTLNIETIEKDTKSVRINLGKFAAELNEEITATIDLGDEMTAIGWAYTADETMDASNESAFSLVALGATLNIVINLRFIFSSFFLFSLLLCVFIFKKLFICSLKS